MTKKKAQPSKSPREADPDARGAENSPARRKKKAGNGLGELVVVGIGASAGGLEALSGMISNLPKNLNAAYVVAQHLDPSHRSMLGDLLGRQTDMPVVEAQDQMVLEAGHIYVSPPDRDISLFDGKMRLSKIMGKIGPKPSVDYFLTSLAETVGSNAVAVILSGTGSDGAHGLRAIKAAGGITIAQDVESAKYSGMPSSAIATGHVDLVAPPKKIAEELPAMLRYRPATGAKAQPQAPADALHAIIALLRDQSGTDFSAYKRNTIIRRVNRRMVVHKVQEVDEYVRYLQHSPKEITTLYRDILISVTSFFRDKQAFEALQHTINRLVRTKRLGDEIRVWVPGCASGEEAYSIAILFAEALGEKLDRYNLQIFGTDLDDDAIATARRGVYPVSTVVDVDKGLLDRYFVQSDGNIRVVKRLRDLVVYAHQNLIKDPPFSHLDLISCRNLLIYFNPDVQQRVLELCHYALVPGGILFLGKSESVGRTTDLFDPINKTARLFKRLGGIRNSLAGLAAYRPPAPVRFPAGGAMSMEQTIGERVTETLADAYAPPSVVVDHQTHIVHVVGDVNDYLRLSPGDAKLDVVSMARKEVRLELRTVLSKCHRDWEPQTSGRVSLVTGSGPRAIQIEARPLVHSPEAERLVVLSFHESPAIDVLKPTTAAADTDESRMYELEHELTSTRERLQTTVEELETANEELQSLNEELQSSNEELQSSNEELETTNEELQSTNEELTTVNEELQVKSAELSEALADLENIQNDIGIPLVVVDKDLRVTRYTPDAKLMFDLQDGDVGNVITTIASHVDLPNLRDTLLEVIERAQTHEREVIATDSVYALRIFPYRSHARAAPIGAVLAFFDRTDVHRLQERIAELESAGHNKT